jgi:tetratricopeptide (TPR) repeat protein
MELFKDNQISLPVIYLVFFVGILLVSAFFVVRQIFKVRSLESTLGRLERKLKAAEGTAQEYYELGSIYLDKKLFVRSIELLQRSLKVAATEEGAENPENLALVYNALGYAYFAQEQYDLAIKSYKKALELQEGYVTAMNNLGHAYEQKKLTKQALEMYDLAMSLEPKNETAKRRSTALKRRLVAS